MSAAVWSYFGGWWTRLLGRVGRSLGRERPAGVEAAPPAPPLAEAAEPPALAPRRVMAPPREAVKEALAATLKGAALDQTIAPFDAGELSALRARTLDELKHLQQIPALQSFARSFHSTMGRVDVDIGDIVEGVAKDSALCVRILRMANSAAVGAAQRIEDLDTAVQMLGVTQVRKIAQTLFTLRDGSRLADGFDWRHLWLHAIATAAIADELDKQLRGEPPAGLHVAALLHDVGKIVLSTVAPVEYRTILVATWQERGRLEELERLRLGVDHREAGVHFARQSGLSEMVVEAIAHHDQPELAEACRFEVALVSLANHISKVHGLGFSGARLETGGEDFVSLPAWRVIGEELGRRPDIEGIEFRMDAFAGTVRAELREMAGAH